MKKEVRGVLLKWLKQFLEKRPDLENQLPLYFIHFTCGERAAMIIARRCRHELYLSDGELWASEALNALWSAILHTPQNGELIWLDLFGQLYASNPSFVAAFVDYCRQKTECLNILHRSETQKLSNRKLAEKEQESGEESLSTMEFFSLKLLGADTSADGWTGAVEFVLDIHGSSKTAREILNFVERYAKLPAITSAHDLERRLRNVKTARGRYLKKSRS
jgi:hypothetical protein